MARVAREPAPSNPLADESAWEAAGLQASSTFDVCSECEGDYCLWTGEPWPEPEEQVPGLAPYNDEPLTGDWIVAAGLDHPPYDDGETYTCAICDKTLTGGD